jgi:cytochrome c-type biogenesis protein CcmH
MLFWAAAFLIAAAVALPLLAAVLRARSAGVDAAASDIAVYRDQLREVDRDLARGVLTEAEAEAVRTEVSRRLLDADRRSGEAERAGTGARGPVAVLVVAALLAGSWALYSRIGAPGYPDLPMGERLAAIDAAAASRISQLEAEQLAAPNMPPRPEADSSFLELMNKLRATLAERPDDVRGLALLAENEARLGNFAAAREAQARILEVKGADATADDLQFAIDIMVFGAGGYVSPEAEALIRRLLDLDPEDGAGRYYAGLMLAQIGRPDRAFPIWRRLLEQGPQDAPWVPVIRSEIAGVAAAAGVDYAPPDAPGPSAADVAAAGAMTDGERQEMIRGMVEGLAARLASDGGTAEEWARLITALGVLGDTERAGTILAEARGVFAGDTASLDQIEAAAARAGLSQ